MKLDKSLSNLADVFPATFTEEEKARAKTLFF